MPNTKVEKIFFGILMSVLMALGMEVYNVAFKMGSQGSSLYVDIRFYLL